MSEARCLRSGDHDGNDLQCSNIPVRRGESYFIYSAHTERVANATFRPMGLVSGNTFFGEAEYRFNMERGFVVPETGILMTASRIEAGGYSTIDCGERPEIVGGNAFVEKRCLNSGERTGNDLSCVAIVYAGERCYGGARIQSEYFTKLIPFSAPVQPAIGLPDSRVVLDRVYRAATPLFLNLSIRIRAGGYAVIRTGVDPNRLPVACGASGENNGNDQTCAYYVNPGEYFMFSGPLTDNDPWSMFVTPIGGG